MYYFIILIISWKTKNGSAPFRKTIFFFYHQQLWRICNFPTCNLINWPTTISLLVTEDRKLLDQRKRILLLTEIAIDTVSALWVSFSGALIPIEWYEEDPCTLTKWNYIGEALTLGNPDFLSCRVKHAHLSFWRETPLSSKFFTIKTSS